jgi:hypothetical protein
MNDELDNLNQKFSAPREIKDLVDNEGLLKKEVLEEVKELMSQHPTPFKGKLKLKVTKNNLAELITENGIVRYTMPIEDYLALLEWKKQTPGD